MANRKLTDLTELLTPADGDFIYIVDVSDTTESLQGTSKKIKKEKFIAGNDVVEGYLLTGFFYQDEAHTIVITPETGKLYIDITIGEGNSLYRYTGAVYEAVDAYKKYKTVVYEGDSITAYTVGPSYGTTNYPTQIVNYNSHVARATQINVATSGQRLSTFISSGQYASQIEPNKPTSNKEVVLFCLMIGINDFFDGRTASQVYDDLKTVWAEAKADGFTVVAFALTRSTNGTVDAGSVATNTLIASDRTLYDYIVRTDLILPNPADLTYYEADGLHLNAEGSKKLAIELDNVLNFQKPGVAPTDALLAGGGTLPFPIGAGGTGVANFIPMYTAPGFIGLSKMAHSALLDVLYVDSKMSVGLAPSYATPVGQFNIKTGAVLSYNLAGQDMGSFSFGNASGSANIPTVIGKSFDNRGLFFIAACPDINASPDMDFNIRENDDSDFTTMTGGGFKWGRQNTQLMYLSRLGVLKIENLAGTGTRQVVADSSGNLSAVSLQPGIYKAILNQAGVADPVPIVLNNSTGVTWAWTRVGVGQYRATPSAGTVNNTKTYTSFFFGEILATGAHGYSISISGTTASYIEYNITNAGVNTDALSSRLSIGIEIYP